jgi:hypothetical protein
MNVKYVMIAGMMMFLVGCNNNPAGELTTVKVKEVEQVGNYTYLLVKARGPEYWVAVPSMEASPGETYQYQGGMLMKDFYSQELNRNFEEVLFLEAIFPEGGAQQHEVQEMTPGSMTVIEKSKVRVEAGEGTLSIAELYANPKAFEGKTVQVRGEVTKYNPAIMERNWVHLQDGTEHKGKFDLTATSTEPFEVGMVVTMEGILAINKDFGYGYNYEILLEEAKAVN